MEISSLLPEKKIFEGFFTIYGLGGHLGHVTGIMSINFHFPVPFYIQNSVKNGPVVSEKSQF